MCSHLEAVGCGGVQNACNCTCIFPPRVMIVPWVVFGWLLVPLDVHHWQSQALRVVLNKLLREDLYLPNQVSPTSITFTCTAPPSQYIASGRPYSILRLKIESLTLRQQKRWDIPSLALPTAYRIVRYLPAPYSIPT